jgi:solute:Na+ symporter, SSS family
MISILTGFFGISEEVVRYYVFGAMLIVSLYSSLSGLWGVAVTDAIQFAIAMAGTIVLAVVVVNLPQVGGVDGLKNSCPGGCLNLHLLSVQPGKSLMVVFCL